MTERIATTPFGSGQFSATIFLRQTWLEEQRKAHHKSANHTGNQTGKADKWQLLRALTEARATFKLSDRTIALLEALLSFHQEKELDGLHDIIVFPSNAELSLRTRGMAPATLRRHLAELVKAGLIIRRDSPNGKRYARKDNAGHISQAFGFNLAPFAMMAPQIFEAAERTNALARSVKKVRGEITIHLRDIAGMIDLAYKEGMSAAQPSLWSELHGGLKRLSGRVSKVASLEELKTRCASLVRLRAEVEKGYLESLSEEDLCAADDAIDVCEDDVQDVDKASMSGNDSRFERHIHNSKTECIFDSGLEKKLKADLGAIKERTEDNEGLERKRSDINLAKLRLICPDFADYAREGLKDWPDALAACAVVRPMLGISKDAWEKAISAMGQGAALAVLAYIVQRGSEIKSAGGYLRSLTQKAENGGFSIKPMMDSLIERGS